MLALLCSALTCCVTAVLCCVTAVLCRLDVEMRQVVSEEYDQAGELITAVTHCIACVMHSLTHSLQHIRTHTPHTRITHHSHSFCNSRSGLWLPLHDPLPRHAHPSLAHHVSPARLSVWPCTGQGAAGLSLSDSLCLTLSLSLSDSLSVSLSVSSLCNGCVVLAREDTLNHFVAHTYEDSDFKKPLKVLCSGCAVRTLPVLFNSLLCPFFCLVCPVCLSVCPVSLSFVCVGLSCLSVCLLGWRAAQVVFDGEEGIDEGGVRKEYYQVC